MLDECKGERLEEVLAAFSSAVLKQVIAQDISNTGEHAALAARLALEDRDFKSDTSKLTALVWTHKASLSGVLRRKQNARGRYRQFSERLSDKKLDLSRKEEAIKAKEGPEGEATPKEADVDMWRTIRNNWSGNQQWMNALYSGDSGTRKGSLLEIPYDRVWRHMQKGTLAELEEHELKKREHGFLEQLDGRVRAQRKRLEERRSFHQRQCQDRPNLSPSKQTRQRSKTKGIDLGFGAHEALHVGRASPRKTTLGGRKPILTDEYHELVRGLEDELLETGPKRSSSLAFLQRPVASRSAHQRSASVPGSETVSEVSSLDDEDAFSASPPIQSFPAKYAQTKRQPVLRPKMSLSGEWFAANTATASARSSNESVEVAYSYPTEPQLPAPEREASPEDDDDPTPVAGSPERRLERGAQTPEQDQHMNNDYPTPRDISPSPTQELADQILESMALASPSPTKRPKPRHTLSLTERTRLSMARGSFTFPDHEEPDLPLRPAPANQGDRRATTAAVEYEDLTARTRKSMAGFEKAQQKAQMERRRSLRKSKAPPRKEGSYFPKVAEEEDQTMLAEELMAEEDMEAVFRSRPKIKASPIPSPTREWDADEYM